MHIEQIANNQLIIVSNFSSFFYSYGQLIAMKHGTDKYILDKYLWDYSRTTLKHLKIYLGVKISKKEIQMKINKNEYFTADLSKVDITLKIRGI